MDNNGKSARDSSAPAPGILVEVDKGEEDHRELISHQNQYKSNIPRPVSINWKVRKLFLVSGVLMIIAAFCSALFFFWDNSAKAVTVVVDSKLLDATETTVAWEDGYARLPVRFPGSDVLLEQESYYQRPETAYYHDIAPDGKRVYVLYSDEAESNRDFKVDILERGVSGRLVLKGSFTPSFTKRNVLPAFHMKLTVKDSLLYVVYKTNDEKFFIDVIDVLDAKNPETVTTHQFGGLGGEYQMQEVLDVKIEGNLLYIENIISKKPVIADSLQQYQITQLDVAHPLRSHPAGSIFLGKNIDDVIDVAYRGDVVYVLKKRQGYNFSNSVLEIYSDLKLVSTLSLPNAVELKTEGSRLYVKRINTFATGPAYLSYYDISFPDVPAYVGNIILDNYLSDSAGSAFDLYAEGAGEAIFPSLSEHVAFNGGTLFLFDGIYVHEIDTTKERKTGDLIKKSELDAQRITILDGVLYSLNYHTGIGARKIYSDQVRFERAAEQIFSEEINGRLVGVINGQAIILSYNDENVCDHIAVYDASKDELLGATDLNIGNRYCHGIPYPPRVSSDKKHLIIHTGVDGDYFGRETLVYTAQNFPLFERVTRTKHMSNLDIQGSFGYFIEKSPAGGDKYSLSVVSLAEGSISEVLDERVSIDLPYADLTRIDIVGSKIFLYSNWPEIESMQVVDITIPQKPRSEGVYRIPRGIGFVSDFTYIGTNAFVLTEDNYIYAYDFSDPRQVQLVGKVHIPRAESFGYQANQVQMIDDAHIMVLGRRGHLEVIDASDPKNMRTVSSIPNYYQDYAQGAVWSAGSIIVEDGIREKTFRRYVQPHSLDKNRIQSIKINNTDSLGVRAVTVIVDENVPVGTGISYFASNDGGSTWQEVFNGEELLFKESSGTDLRVRAELATKDAYVSPEIRSFTVVYR